jgi:deoxycytidine triphosphate deaminase
MSLLRDIDLVAELDNNPSFVAGLPRPTSENLYSAESPIQPSSIDLHIGEISIPADSPDRPFKQIRKGDHVLKPGNTAVIQTLETLNLPKILPQLRSRHRTSQ